MLVFDEKSEFSGGGIIDSLIDKIPLELHLPGSNCIFFLTLNGNTELISVEPSKVISIAVLALI